VRHEHVHDGQVEAVCEALDLAAHLAGGTHRPHLGGRAAVEIAVLELDGARLELGARRSDATAPPLLADQPAGAVGHLGSD